MKLKFRLLDNKIFVRLWMVNLLSSLADSVDSTLITLLAVELTHSARATGILLSITSIPGIILSIIGGTISDTKNKRKILFFMTLAQGSIIAILVILIFIGKVSFIALCIILFFLECCSRFYTPAFVALNVSIVPKEHYTKAQSFITSTTSLAQMIGVSFFTVLYSVLGKIYPFLINSLCYFSSGFIIMKTKLSNETEILRPKLPSIETKDITKENSDIPKYQLYKNLKEGVIYLLTNHTLLYFISIITVTNFCLALFDVGLPFFISDQLNLSIEYMGYMRSFSTFAFVMAGILMARKTYQRPFLVITLSLSIMGFCTIFMSLSKSFVLSALFWCGAAFFRTIVAILLMSYIATVPDKKYVGRVMGVVSTLFSIIFLIARGVSGLIVDHVGAGYMFFISGVVFVILALLTHIKRKVNGNENDNIKPDNSNNP